METALGASPALGASLGARGKSGARGKPRREGQDPARGARPGARGKTQRANTWRATTSVWMTWHNTSFYRDDDIIMGWWVADHVTVGPRRLWSYKAAAARPLRDPRPLWRRLWRSPAPGPAFTPVAPGWTLQLRSWPHRAKLAKGWW